MSIKTKKSLFLALIGLVALLAGACVGTPGYLIDIYPEMHYSPVYRPQEPPRISAPADAVPISGKEAPLTLDQAKLVQSPLEPTSENAARGIQVFMVNCAICHGPTGRGNGPMAQRFENAFATPPVDFTSERVRSRTDGELFYFITNGIGFMPHFGPLLSADDRWAVIPYIHATQQ